MNAPDLEGDLLRTLPAARWFGGKSRAIRAVGIEDRAATDGGDLLLATVRFEEGAPETYVLPAEDRPSGPPSLHAALLALILRNATAAPLTAKLTHAGAPALPSESAGSRGTGVSRVLGGEQSHTSVVFADRLHLKLLRRVEAGAHPELEALEALYRAGFTPAPVPVGSLSWNRPGREPTVVGILTSFVPNEGTVWDYLLDVLPDRVPEKEIRLLGKRTGEMHRAFAEEGTKPFERADTAELALSMDEYARRALEEPQLAAREPQILARCCETPHLPVSGEKIRIHGDLHAGQVLRRGDDFVFIDFEGEPARPLAERSAPRSPLEDVAGMLRSLHYATASSGAGPEDHRALVEAFFAGYSEVMAGSGLLPGPRELPRLLDAFTLRKALYEVVYERNHRPTWVPVPVAGVQEILDHGK